MDFLKSRRNKGLNDSKILQKGDLWFYPSFLDLRECITVTISFSIEGDPSSGISLPTHHIPKKKKLNEWNIKKSPLPPSHPRVSENQKLDVQNEIDYIHDIGGVLKIFTYSS